MSSNLIRFGTFEVCDRADRTRNPHTGGEIQIAASVSCF
ncbi:HU family DNA-binding protein [Peribacillus sp. NPDC006672]